MEDEDMAREPEAIAELRRSLGVQLATFRLAAELRQGQLGKVAICDRTTIVHIEKGRGRADERFWRIVDDACGASGVLLAAYLELEAAKAEHERRERDQRLASVRARAAELRGQPDRSAANLPAEVVTSAQRADVPLLDSLRSAVLGHLNRVDLDGENRPLATAQQVDASIEEAHRLYQMADYDSVARILPSIVRRLEEPSGGIDISTHRKTITYLVAAKLATKLGDAGLAWVAADRSVQLATETDHQGLIGVANYQVACALLSGGHLADAEQTASMAVEKIAARSRALSQSVQEASAQGGLTLLLAVMTARRGDAHAAHANLQAARRLAAHVGQDSNFLYTAFGPTNVAIHELGVHVALGDARKALQFGEVIDTDVLPTVLRGRRSQVHLELGKASVDQGNDSMALLHLLEAERVAKQVVSRNATARTLIATLLSRERKSAMPGLRALASRAEVLV
ncbi:helix-turn-helix domain-containing protein [Actinokineospora sp.]|uniref:helix-turn-helix domain-containing protein n=1 Tax=Actinokineospora sp. TaxID=1872133 RepID=UPI0040383736